MDVIGLINEGLVSTFDLEGQDTLSISDNVVNVGNLKMPRPKFDEKHDKNKDFVLVQVVAFSCNYRDKAIVVKSSNKMSGAFSNTAAPVSFFGSDFVGIIIEKGTNVSEFELNDRVIPNCAYPTPPADGVAPGVVTNEASKGYLKLHKSKLLKVPDNMPNSIAAGYSIGGQTSESMVRRSNVSQSDKVLVLSARSNTSLFIINALLHRGIKPTLLSTTKWSEDNLDLVKHCEVINLNRNVNKWPDDLEKFDVIFDPFFDIHLEEAIKHLNIGGRYITCGYKNQHESFEITNDIANQQNLQSIMLTAMVNNISIIGNCIGETFDLENSLKNFNYKLPPFQIDSTLSTMEFKEFLDETYNKRNRFGKVIMNYVS
ncbi:zinc-binding alcohol dehydrogenase family protein [Pediococcus pentosaceus]|uniref:PenN n=1 Tax=Pediococcus pentosaceus TaxID=1255 RepID=Q9WVY7_PEDPE|nr:MULTISPECIES: zinc-binding alcohol dehydrogenase family protein [Lactobacillaceae]AAD25908.1 PenN [Pediococcus pentosaceus]AAD39631.1 unknown [Pediococcus pentosaceus]MBF7126212.1 zinc-binding alcohol dehydrogenase family protein [Pediococcus pentosaceus]WPK17599.1 zinc-binding alcohol dehydrogenase family protein [Pediococcus pentosaceus]